MTPRQALSGFWGNDPPALSRAIPKETRMQSWRPPIRSSQAGVALSNPFQYLLQHRYCIRPTEATYAEGFIQREDSAGDPLLLGSVFHWCLEHAADDNWVAAAENLIPPDATRGQIADVRKAITMARAVLQVPACGYKEPLLQWLERFKTIGRELFLEWSRNDVPCAGILDRLIEDPRTGNIWIVDYKTTSRLPSERARTCSYEFQAWHYMHAVEQVRGELPAGIIHVIVQKPGIRIGREDRPYTEHLHTLRSGPRKGQQEVRREYLAEEPDPDLYFERVARWYTGQGEYADRSIINSDPLLAPILIHTTRTEDFGDHWRSEYASIFDRIATLRAMPAYPQHFPRVAGRGGESVYDPFYTLPMSQWPAYMERAHLIQKPRTGDPIE